MLSPTVSKSPGLEGAERENEVRDIVRSYGMRMVGPIRMAANHATYPAINLNATFSPTDNAPGDVAFLTQSGQIW